MIRTDDAGNGSTFVDPFPVYSKSSQLSAGIAVPPGVLICRFRTATEIAIEPVEVIGA